MLLWGVLGIIAVVAVFVYGSKNFNRLIGRRARHALAAKGWWEYHGLRGMHPAHWPEGFVRYPDGGCTVNMALGNAFNYKSMFGGEVYDAGETMPHCPHGHKDWDDCPVCCH